MKKFILILLTLHFSLLTSFAIPAYPKMMKVTQADGTQIEVRLLGDEYRHILVTEDGYPLAFNDESENYEYATIADGKLIRSGLTATPLKTRTKEVKNFLSGIDKTSVNDFFAASDLRPAMNEALSSENNGKANKIVRISDVPTLGTHKALVVLVNFANKSFSSESPAEYYDDFFHKEGFDQNGAQGCVYEWYAKGSNYNYDPQFDVYGPVTVSGNYATYAGDGTSLTYKMVKEVISLIDDEVNFADYDTDGDGVCDNIYCIYAGYGQADTGNTKYIWPHSGYLSQVISGWSYKDYSMEADSVKIDRYTVSCEMNGISRRIEGIGTFVHEFGHVLGLADHYNNQNSYSTNQPGEWDVMASASYNNDQNTPPLFTAFERYSLGWMDLTELTLDADTLISLAHLEDSVKAYRVSVPNKSGEYFIIENRQQDGWDKYIPGHGALVWHIDEKQSVWDSNMANYYSNHQRVDVVEAGGVYSVEGTASDPFPGTKDVKNYTFNSWAGKEIFGFANVEEEDSVVTFLLDGTDFKIDKPTLTVSDIAGTTATLKWDHPTYARTYNLYVKNGNELILKKEKLEIDSLQLSGLEGETEYTVQIIAVNSKLVSDTTEVVFSTIKKQIYEEQVVALPATDMTTNSFTANWEPLDLAESYEVTLMKRELTGSAEVGTGFDDYSAEEQNLPDGWSTNATTTPSSQYYGTALPSFRFNADSLNLEIRQPGSQLQSLRFWHRSNNKSNYVMVEQLVDGAWQYVDSIAAAAGKSVVDTIALDNAEAVRLVYHHKLGYFLVDDVYATYSYNEYQVLDTQETADTTCVFADLDESQLYSYAVRAKAGDDFSVSSSTIDVDLLVDKIDIIPAVSEKDGTVYNIAGQRLAAPKKGINIIRGRKVLVK